MIIPSNIFSNDCVNTRNTCPATVSSVLELSRNRLNGTRSAEEEKKVLLIIRHIQMNHNIQQAEKPLHQGHPRKYTMAGNDHIRLLVRSHDSFMIAERRVYGVLLEFA